jgi:hypothetical protein
MDITGNRIEGSRASTPKNVKYRICFNILSSRLENNFFPKPGIRLECLPRQPRDGACMTDDQNLPSGCARTRAAGRARRAQKVALRERAFEALASGFTPQQIARSARSP